MLMWESSPRASCAAAGSATGIGALRPDSFHSSQARSAQALADALICGSFLTVADAVCVSARPPECDGLGDSLAFRMIGTASRHARVLFVVVAYMIQSLVSSSAVWRS